jgi:hypothetical protein
LNFLPLPLVAKEDTVGLEGVLNPGVGLLILLLKLHGPAEEIEPQEGRLSTLPRHRHLGGLMGLEELLDEGFVHLIGHAKITSRIKPFLLQEEAVVPMKIARRTRWLDHDVKRFCNHSSPAKLIS